MQMLPRISIVTPSYNQGQYIDQAIESVLIQNYPNFEHIVIDNCSTDGTVDILKRYEHLKWVSEPDKGQSDALNKGFLKAEGQIVGWLNADDYFLPKAFENFLECYENNRDGDFFYGNYCIVNSHRKALRLVRPISYDFKITLHYGPYIPSSGSFLLKKLINDGFLLDIEHRYNMDRKFFLDIGAAKKKFVYINHTISCFRIHEDNASNPSSSAFTHSTRTERQEEEAEKVFYYYSHALKNKFLEKIRRKLLRLIYRIKFLLIRVINWRFSKKLDREIIY